MITQATDTQINQAIDEITTHRLFRRSPLMCAFLRYVTAETLAGREGRISAYSVGIDALGKIPSFDPQTDPSVRVLAKRLRDSLDEYYSSAVNYDVMVVMKPGSYVPVFEKIAYYRRAF